MLFSQLSLCTFGQGQKIIFLEGLGAGVYASVNFDMRFKKDENDGFGFRAGVGNSFILDENIMTIPLGVNYVFGKRKHGLLAGVNGTVGVFKRLRPGAFNRKAGDFLPSWN